MARNEKTVWNRFAGIYDRFMKKDEEAYRAMVRRIAVRLGPDDRVLEIATGTGILALGLAHSVRAVDAVDFSVKMIRKAKEKARASGIGNVRFDVQDALALSFPDGVFDAVLIANTLHIMPEPEKALAEARRVLKPGGILFAPTFVHADSKKAAFLSRLMSLTGFRAYHKWNMNGFLRFMEANGFKPIESELFQASFPLAYAAFQPTRNFC